MTAAYLLNRLGHEAVVFESTSQLGGLLRTGLPQDRLPDNILDWEIEGILDTGVQVKKNMALGKDFTIDSLLKDGFSSVFVATGGWDTLLPEISKNDGSIKMLPGIQLLVNFVLNYRAGIKTPAGNHVMILGGGKAALEAAEASLKNGAQDVTVVIRNPKDKSGLSSTEITEAENSGIIFRFQSVLTAMTGVGRDLSHVEIAHLSETGSETGERDFLEIDALLTGAGRFPELIYIPVPEDEGSAPDEIVKWKTLIPYAGPFAEHDLGIFRPGEENSDYKAVVEAIGSGRRATSSIQHYFSGESLEPPDSMIRKNTQVLNLEQLEPVPQSSREKMTWSSHESQINNPDMEMAEGYSEEQARRESERCLQCGLICYRRTEGTLHALH